MDTLGHADAPAACIVMESNGQAGPSVTGNASRREGHAEKEERGKRLESSAEVSLYQGFDEH